MSLWNYVQERLGLDVLLGDVEHVHNHLQRQENTMAKLSDELADLSRRQDAIRDAITTSGANLRTEIEKLQEQVADLSSGELDADNQAKVDEIKATADNIRAAAEGIDDGFEAPVVEPSPFPEGNDGSVENTDNRAL